MRYVATLQPKVSGCCQRNCIKNEQCSPHGSYQLFNKLILWSHHPTPLYTFLCPEHPNTQFRSLLWWWLPDFIDAKWGLLWSDKHCWRPEIWTLVFKRCCKYHSIHKTLKTLLLCAVTGRTCQQTNLSSLTFCHLSHQLKQHIKRPFSTKLQSLVANINARKRGEKGD